MGSIKEKIVDNVKNIPGWKTNRKIVVFAVDDYGNVRLDSKQAREAMNRDGLKVMSRFDAFDTLETADDLELLYGALASVKDKNGRHAIFTPFALPGNINFEKIAESGYTQFYNETLPETYAKLKGYNGSWNMWLDGIKQGFMAPQFHGREHVNVKLFNEKLRKKDRELLTSLKYRSLTSITSPEYSTISVMASFDFWDIKENESFRDIITSGLAAFEQVYGYRATCFIAPSNSESSMIHCFLKDEGIKFMDSTFVKSEHLGFGRYKKKINFTGKKNETGQYIVMRNVVFEPTDNRGFNWVAKAMEQIEASFRWNTPAIISSHRVNFSGFADEANRATGIVALKRLLKEIVKKWPDVEFMSSAELGSLITGENDIQEFFKEAY